MKSLALVTLVTLALCGCGTTTQRTASVPTARAEPLDINSASVDALTALPGIDDAYAKRIVAARPYKEKDELVKKGILPQPIYDKIKDQIVAKQK